MALGSLVISAWVVLGSWVAIFPGTIERVLGVSYGFKDNWGVTRTKFEVYTLVTLAIIVGLGLAGYAAGAKVRRASAFIEGETPGPAAPVPTG
jgi:hypothetical protein